MMVVNVAVETGVFYQQTLNVALNTYDDFGL